MLEKKSDKLSIHFKNDGNKSFAKKHYYDALISWNKALCYAETKENLAMAYANRSLVYFELKKYDLSLNNILLAQENHTGEIQTTLNERKIKCMKLMKTAAAEEPDLNLSSFIKLSHPPNPSIPFIADCLELRNTEFGRGVVTKGNLQVGDVIAIEKNTLSFLCEGGKYKKCCKCCKSFMLNLIPCSRTASLMFCSVKCRDLTYKAVQNLEWMISENTPNIHYERVISEIEEAFCGHDKFLKFLKDLGDVKKCKKTVFDYDFVNNQHAKLSTIKSSLSLTPSTVSKGYSHQVLEAARKVAKGNSVIENFMKHLANILESNCYLARNDEEITGNVQAIDAQRFYPFYCLFNHCCNANVFTLEADDALIYYVVNPIKANEQLFINYLGNRSINFPASIRQDKLYSNFGFICDCTLCSDDTSLDENKSIYEKAMEKAKFSRYVMKKENDLYASVLENWRIVNSANLSTSEAHLLIMHSHFMLEQLITILTEPTH